MKKFFFLFFLAVSASTAMAQSQKLFESNGSGNFPFSSTLPEFSFNGKVQIYHKDINDKYIFYSDEFEKQNEMTFSGPERDVMYKTEQREWKDDGYKGDLKVIEDYSGKESGHIINLRFDDFDQSCVDFRDIDITQTLFNTDEKFEFLTPLYSYSGTKTDEQDWDGDGVIDYRSTYTNYKVTGFQIVSEDGTVLKTVNFEGGFTPDFSSTPRLLKVNGKCYLWFYGNVGDSDTDYHSAYLLYSIDPAKSTVRMMSMEKVSSIPTRSYNLSGRPTKGEKGINIIRMSDGTVKKVLVR